MKKKYTTQNQLASPASGSSRQTAKSMSSYLSSQVTGSPSISKFPLSPSDKLASRFCQLLGSDMQVAAGTNLASFGKFMIQVPLHIGHSRVLDLSAESLYVAHGAIFGKDNTLLVRSQILYGQALQSLQKSLEDIGQARSPETLCATLLLSIYEVGLPRGFSRLN